VHNTFQCRALTEADLAEVARLARRVWQATYPGIISQAQIDAMLAVRYTDAALRTYLDADDRWLEIVEIDGKIAGFCACELHDGECKLDKIYIDPAHQRRGLGSLMMGRATDHARSLGYSNMILAVNKRNVSAIAAYRKQGFAVRQSVCVDIGNGFVMDDFIMQKQL